SPAIYKFCNLFKPIYSFRINRCFCWNLSCQISLISMKKVLIIAYYWPPAGGPGVQRWLKFVKYLPDFEIEPIVYVPENATYPILDQELESEINKNITILKQPINEPYKLASIFSKKSTTTISSGIIKAEKKQSFVEKILLNVRGNFFIPDARVGWVKPPVD